MKNGMALTPKGFDVNNPGFLSSPNALPEVVGIKRYVINCLFLKSHYSTWLVESVFKTRHSYLNTLSLTDVASTINPPISSNHKKTPL